MDLGSFVIVLAVVAVVVLVAVSVTFRDQLGGRESRPDQADGPGPLAGARDVVDGSIGMYVLRRVFGRRPSPPPVAVPPAAALTADEVAYRIGVAGAPEPPTAREVTPVPAAVVVGASATTAPRATTKQARIHPRASASFATPASP